MTNDLRSHEKHNGPDGNGATQERMDEIKQEACAAAEKAGEQANELKREVSQLAEQVAQKLQALSTTAYGMVKDRSNELGETAGALNREVTGVIRRYPLQTLAAGAALGFLLGKALDLRRR